MLWLRIALAPVLLFGVLWAVDLQDVGRVLSGASAGWLAAALGFSVAANFVSAWRWRSLVLWLDQPIGLRRMFSLYLQGMALSSLLPGAVVGGDLYRAVGLRRDGVGPWPAGASVLLDRLSGLWMLWVLSAGAVAWAWTGGAQEALVNWGMAGHGRGLPLAMSLLLLVVPVAIICAGRWLPSNGKLAKLTNLMTRPGITTEFCRQVLGSAIVQLLSVAALACGGRALGLDVPFWVYVITAAPIFLMAALPVSFGGWGTREAAAALSLAPFGVAAPAAVAVGLVYGIVALPQAMAGLVLIVLHRRREPLGSA